MCGKRKNEGRQTDREAMHDLLVYYDHIDVHDLQDLDKQPTCMYVHDSPTILETLLSTAN